MAYLQAKAADVLQPDIVRVGGYTEARRIADLASAHGRRVAPHYLPELSTHLVCGLANGWLVEEVLGGSLRELGMSSVGFIADGVATAPAAGVGHGISFDEVALASCEVDRARVRVAPRTVVHGGI